MVSYVKYLEFIFQRAQLIFNFIFQKVHLIDSSSQYQFWFPQMPWHSEKVLEISMFGISHNS